MTALEQQVEALMRLCTACDEASRKEAREEIRYLMQGRPGRSAFRDPEYQLRQILLELGAPDHLLGHPYVIQAVLLVIQDRAYIDNITFRLYPQLAAQFDTTASRVERAIRHLVEVTWTRGDLETVTNKNIFCIFYIILRFMEACRRRIIIKFFCASIYKLT